jgi:hypothetical protein
MGMVTTQTKEEVPERIIHGTSLSHDKNEKQPKENLT